MTPILETTERVLQRCQKNGFAGCIQYPLKRLQKQDSEQALQFFFELYIYNTAGHFTVVKTETFTLPSRFSPGNATVFDLYPFKHDTQTDVDFHDASQQACVYWTGFYHHHNVTFYVGIGHQPNGNDVVQFAKVEQNPVCINSSALTPNKKYFTSVKAECSGGNTVSSSDGFVIIDDGNGQYSFNVYDGKECDSKGAPIGMSHPLVKSNQLYGFRTDDLVIGVEHTVFITNTQIDFASTNISSTKAIILGKHVSGHSISFIPTAPDPELKLDKPLSTSADIQVFVRQCINDIDSQLSTFEYSMHWDTRGELEQYVTHFIISLDQTVCNNASDDCISEIASTTVQGTMRNYTWNRLSLTQTSFVKANVQPCFENVCLKSKSSNGVHIAHKPVVVSLGAEILVEFSNCTHISVTMDAVCDVGDTSGTFQWYLAKQRDGHQHITSMITVHKQQSSPVKV